MFSRQKRRFTSNRRLTTHVLITKSRVMPIEGALTSQSSTKGHVTMGSRDAIVWREQSPADSSLTFNDREVQNFSEKEENQNKLFFIWQPYHLHTLWHFFAISYRFISLFLRLIYFPLIINSPAYIFIKLPALTSIGCSRARRELPLSSSEKFPF